MVQSFDDFEVDTTIERKHEIAGTESRVQPAITESGTEVGAESLHARGQTFGSCCVGEMVQSHGSILAEAVFGDVTGVCEPDAIAQRRRCYANPAAAEAEVSSACGDSFVGQGDLARR